MSCNSEVISKNSNNFRVLDVVDGDTFIIDDGYRSRVRMLGIDTPEILSDDGPGEPFSLEAKKYLSALIENKLIRIEYGNEKFDPYGRILAYVFSENIFVNKEILKIGLARAFILSEGEKYSSELLEAELDAKRSAKGIWGSIENFKYPQKNNDFLIKAASAGRYIDQRVVVSGKITDTKQNKKVDVLKVEDDLDIVIFKDNLSNFKHFQINPLNFYTGHLVEVIGRVTVYRGKTQIAVYHPMSIRKLK
ncbi:MAG: thermonuclease family protein [Thermodesulfobacteriota bacterium]